MENKSHAFIAGVFTIFFTIGVIIVGIWLGQDNIPQRDFMIETQESVSGLNPQARVNFRGIRVGRVTDITFDPQKIGTIQIHIRVEASTPVTPTTWAILRTQGLTGVAFIELDDKVTTNTNIVYAPDNYIIPLRSGSSLDDLAKKGGEFLDTANQVLTDIRGVMSPDNAHGVPALVKELTTTAEATRTVIEGASPALSNLGPLVDNLTQASSSVVQITQKVDGTLTKVAGQGGAIDQLSRIMSNMTDETLPRMNQTLDNAARTSRDLSQLAQQLKANPQSILFGVERVPGPGEEGFTGFPQ